MKYRKNKVKVEHSIIKRLKSFLESNVAVLDHVSVIIPGEIKVGNATGENLIVKYKYNTHNGSKLIAKSGNSIQEIFVVTSDPDDLKKVIESFYSSD